MIIVSCPWCEGDVALESMDAAEVRCEACMVLVELAPEPATESRAIAA